MNDVNVINLLVVTDQPVVRTGLKCFVDDCPDVRMLACAENVADGLKQLQLLRDKPDVLLLAWPLSGTEGVEAIRLFNEEMAAVPILVYSRKSDEYSVLNVLKAGAKGYLLKNSAMSELLTALRRVSLGDYYFSAELNSSIVAFYLKNRHVAADDFGEYQRLSQREQQVFRLLAEGYETDEIADTHCISPKTVAKHRAAVKKKLNLHNAAEMLQYAIRIGVLEV